MIQDFKLAFKLIRYGLSYKLEVSMGLLFAVIGIVVDFFQREEPMWAVSISFSPFL